MTKINRANLFGAELTVTTYAELLEITDELIAKKPSEPYRYNFCNVHVVMMTLENPKLKEAVNHPRALSVTGSPSSRLSLRPSQRLEKTVSER